jgi:hypothetical protein
MLEDGRIARMGVLRNEYSNSIRKPQGKSGLWRPMHINRYNIKMGLN